MGLIKKLRNRLFQILEFCFHDATLEADLARCGRSIDMVVSAFERVDVACFNPNIRIGSWFLFFLENSFENGKGTYFSKIFETKNKKTLMAICH